MQGSGSFLVGLVLAAGGLAAAAPPAAASDPGITVYTWTDANGTKHFSDQPRPRGPATKLVLPTPPPPDQTAIAAQRAWVRKMNREAQADIARAAARRRAERQRQAEAAAEQAREATPRQVEYLPVFFPARRRGGHRHHHGSGSHGARLPSARFPANRLPLPSSFPEEPSFWPPRR